MCFSYTRRGRSVRGREAKSPDSYLWQEVSDTPRLFYSLRGDPVVWVCAPASAHSHSQVPVVSTTSLRGEGKEASAFLRLLLLPGRAVVGECATFGAAAGECGYG